MSTGSSFNSSYSTTYVRPDQKKVILEGAYRNMLSRKEMIDRLNYWGKAEMGIHGSKTKTKRTNYKNGTFRYL